MAPSIERVTERTEAHKPEPCPHCFGGITYEPTEDTLVDEAFECHMCFGTALKVDRAKRLRIKAERRAR